MGVGKQKTASKGKGQKKEALSQLALGGKCWWQRWRSGLQRFATAINAVQQRLPKPSNGRSRREGARTDRDPRAEERLAPLTRGQGSGVLVRACNRLQALDYSQAHHALSESLESFCMRAQELKALTSYHFHPLPVLLVFDMEMHWSSC